MNVFLPLPLPLAYNGKGLILSAGSILLHFFRMSLMGLISTDSFGKNCAKYITQPMNYLIPLAVRGMGSIEIAFTREPSCVMVGRLSLLESNNPICFSFDLKV